MDALILLRRQADLLTDGELMRCLMSLSRYDQLEMLFATLLTDLQKGEMDRITKLNSLVASMISSRETLSPKSIQPDFDTESDNDIEQEECHEAITLDLLPSNMISHIVSFVKLRDQIRMELCCRSILIGARTTGLFRHLDFFDFVKIIQSTGGNTRLFRSLTIEASHPALGDWECVRFGFFKHIQELCIRFTPDCLDAFERILECLLEGHELRKVTTFRLCCSTTCTISMTLTNKIRSLIREKLPNMQYHENQRVDFTHGSIRSLTVDHAWFKNLKGIAVNGSSIVIYCALVEQCLQSLHYHFISRFGTRSRYDGLTYSLEGKLCNLEEICLYWDQCVIQMQILSEQHMPKLKRVSFGSSNDPPATGSWSQVMLNLLGQMMETVAFIEFRRRSLPDAERQFRQFMDLLETVLKQKKKRKLHLRILESNCNRAGWMISLAEILNANVEEWRLTIREVCNDILGDAEVYQSQWTKLCHPWFTQTINSGRQCYILMMSNVDCNCEFEEELTMNCQQCMHHYHKSSFHLPSVYFYPFTICRQKRLYFAL